MGFFKNIETIKEGTLIISNDKRSILVFRNGRFIEKYVPEHMISDVNGIYFIKNEITKEWKQVTNKEYFHIWDEVMKGNDAYHHVFRNIEPLVYTSPIKASFESLRAKGKKLSDYALNIYDFYDNSSRF